MARAFLAGGVRAYIGDGVGGDARHQSNPDRGTGRMNRRARGSGRNLCMALAIGLTVGLGGCDGSVTEPEILTLIVGPERVECQGEGQRLCLLVKEDPDAEWEFFFDEIEGFEFEPGFIYVLRVGRHRVENPPADGSNFRWVLVEILSKTPAE